MSSNKCGLDPLEEEPSSQLFLFNSEYKGIGKKQKRQTSNKKKKKDR